MTAGPETTSRADEILKQIRGLPPFHPVASQVLRLSCSNAEDLEIDDVAAIIDSDQAFAAEMLQTANSPLFGLQYLIRSSRHAIVILGLERTKGLAVRVAMQIYLKDALDHPVLRRCWLHTLACAEIARTMAISFGKVGADSAHTAGLLHDIGRMALLTTHRTEYIPFLEREYEFAGEISTREVQRFGFDHGQAGHALCNLWKFPAEIGDVALLHHEPVSGNGKNIVDIVRISCRMADSLGFAAVKYSERPVYDQIVLSFPTEMQQHFQFSAGQMQQIIRDRVGRSSR